MYCECQLGLHYFMARCVGPRRYTGGFKDSTHKNTMKRTVLTCNNKTAAVSKENNPLSPTPKCNCVTKKR